MAGIAEYGWKWLEVTAMAVSCWKWLKMDRNGWIWLEWVVMARHLVKWLEMAGFCWK